VEALIAQAQAGDAAALGELRKLMDAHPPLWQSIGDLAFQAEASWLKAIAGEDEVAKEAISRKAKALRRELAGPAPTVLERLLAERVVLCWMALYFADTLYAQRTGTLTLDQSTFYQERIVRFQKLYLAAIKALAQLRRVTVTALRVQAPGGRALEATRVEAGPRAPAPPPDEAPLETEPVGVARFF
jgi:hypothetical protein